MCVYIKRLSVPVIGLGVAQRVDKAIALLFHDKALEGVSGQQHAPAVLYLRRKSRYPLYRRLGGPQGRSGRSKDLASPGFDHRTVQPVAQSLYRLSYPASHVCIYTTPV